MSSIVRASRLGMGLLLGFSALTFSAQAQTTDQQAPLSNPEANADPFSSRGDSNGAIMQLIHRAMRGDANVDRAAESASQRENLSDAANDFFAKRNERLKKKSSLPQSQPAATNVGQPAATSQSGTLNPGTALPLVQPLGTGVVQPVVTPRPEPTSAEPPAAQPSQP